eukprot:Colp12_sorted_trinity150504_noHs@27659
MDQITKGWDLTVAVTKVAAYSLYRYMFGPEEPPPKTLHEVVMLGIEGAGKTTILASLAGEDISAIEPTKGFGIKPVVRPSAYINVKELGGNASIRPYWNRYYENAEGVIFVVNTSDWEENCGDVQEAFNAVLEDEQLSNCPVLLLVNKHSNQSDVGVRVVKI